MPPVEAASVLVYVGLDLLGDGLIKLPFVRALRGFWPKARITWLAGLGASVYAGPLAPLVEGLIDEVIERAGIGRSWREVWRFGPTLPPADLVIDTQRSLRTTLALRRQSRGIFVSSAAGWLFSDCRPPNGTVLRRAMIGQLFQLIEACGAPSSIPLAPLKLDPALEGEAARRLGGGRMLIGLAPGAGGRHKCWPLAEYLALGRELAASGWVPVFLLGPAERDWEAIVRRGVPEAILPLAQDDPPLLTIAIGRRLAAAVANDSGIGHMLAVAETPLVSLFGPTDPAKFAPLAPNLEILCAQDHGGQEMAAIPRAAVTAALKRRIAAER